MSTVMRAASKGVVPRRESWVRMFSPCGLTAGSAAKVRVTVTPQLAVSVRVSAKPSDVSLHTMSMAMRRSADGLARTASKALSTLR